MSTALLVVDMQNGFCHPNGSIPTIAAPLVDNDRVVRRNVEAVNRARTIGVPRPAAPTSAAITTIESDIIMHWFTPSMTGAMARGSLTLRRICARVAP